MPILIKYMIIIVWDYIRISKFVESVPTPMMSTVSPRIYEVKRVIQAEIPLFLGG
jgi:hypothetical protein